jgi:hypothetical protein
MRAWILFALSCPGVALAQRSIDVEVARPIDVHVAVMDTQLGALHGFGFESRATDMGWVELTRERDGIFERYFARTAPPRATLLAMLRGEPPPRPDAARCRSDGECEVTLLPGLTWPRHGLEEPPSSSWRIEIRREVRLRALQRVCRAGDFVWLRRPSSSRDWLAPIGADLSEELTFIPARLARVGVAATIIEPPACALDPGMRTTIVGADPAAEPVFGLFLVRPTDLPAIAEAARTSSRAAFDRARELAVESSADAPRWCEDPVRVVLGVAGGTPGMPLLGAPVDDRRALARITSPRARSVLRERIAELSLRMFRRHDPALCDQSLDRMLAALRNAQRQRLRILHFGY